MAPPVQIVVFGGSFNPPHVGHLAVAEAAASSVGSGVVLWMPASMAPHKQGGAESVEAHHRLAMTRLATAGNERFDVSDLEIQRGEVSFTVDTLRQLKRVFPDAQLALLLGGDSLCQFRDWRDPHAILAMTRLIVYPRPGFSVDGIPSWVMHHVTLLDAPLLRVSSTELRERLREGRSARYLIPDAVLAYVDEHGLYR